MSALPRWVRHSKKRPITTRGFAASSTAPSTWSSFAEAKAAASVGDGLGFVLTGDGIICLDIDHCLSGGRPNPATAELLARTPATFIEVSPSGDGLHVWGKGHVERGRKLPSLEVYGAGRYITVTGERFRRSPAVLADLSEVLSLLI